MIEEIFLLSFSVSFNGGLLFATRRYDIVTIYMTAKAYFMNLSIEELHACIK